MFHCSFKLLPEPAAALFVEMSICSEALLSDFNAPYLE